MNQALYRKYRSRSFDEVIGQEHVTKTLKQAIKSGRISHAYLFTGPKGVGKTSVARILAHEVNQLPYTGEAVHLDIIEIDAASNRRIDEIRDLREKVRIAPAVGKYKIYIIDEVHMLTREAFNALLKTLEEPPAHVIFVLATTEAHKLPETIISRTQRFEFKPISTSYAVNHLQNIANKENIKISAAALELLAESGRGSIRDSISFLDQLSSSSKTISEDNVRELLGLPSHQEVSVLLNAINDAKPSVVLNSLQAIKDQGIDAAAVARALAGQLREEIVKGKSNPTKTNLLRQLIEVPASSQPYDYLEVSLLESCSEPAKKNIKPSEDISQKAEDKMAPQTKTVAAKIATPANLDKKLGPASSMTDSFDLKDWEEVVKKCKDKAASLYTALRLAEPQLSDGILILRFQFPLHKKKLEQAKNKALVAGLIQEVSGTIMEISCEVDKEVFGLKQFSAAEAHPAAVPLQSISNVFGGVEILES
jgi:DNA polymerase-3 subunit gamma/tau